MLWPRATRRSSAYKIGLYVRLGERFKYMTDNPIDTAEHEACTRLDELTTLFGTAEQAVAQSVRRPSPMLPHQVAQLEDILGQMRRQAQRLRACRLGLRLVQGGLAR